MSFNECVMFLIRPLAYVLVAAFYLTLNAAFAEQEQKPLWEVGVGAGGAYSPDYSAASENSLRGIGFPYFVYRGEFFRIGDGAVAKGVLVESQSYDFDLSFDAAFDADSDENEARQGMQDLDFIGEFGPQLTIHLLKEEDTKIDLALPVRAAFSTDFSNLDFRGYVFNPEASLRKTNLFPDIDLYLAGSLVFASEKLQDYFYQVAPEFETVDRLAYDAKGGYMGSNLTFGIGVRKFENFRFFVGGQVNYFEGAENELSPLFKDDLNFSLGFGFVYTFYQSEEMTQLPDFKLSPGTF